MNNSISSNDVKELMPSKELEKAINELEYMENHPEEYKSFSSVKELMKDLNSEDEI